MLFWNIFTSNINVLCGQTVLIINVVKCYFKYQFAIFVNLMVTYYGKACECP